MMTAASTDRTAVHPRDRSAKSWRGKLGHLASHGETDGPQVEEAKAALAWWKHRTALIETGIAPERADALADLIDADTRAQTVEAVAR